MYFRTIASPRRPVQGSMIYPGKNLFPTRLHVHLRMNANGNWHQMIYFPETIIQCNTILVMDTLHYCRPMHNDTYSVHDRSLKPWWSRLPCSQTFCYFFTPPLSGLNWCSSSPFGGPGPPPPKWRPLSQDPRILPFQGPEQNPLLNKQILPWAGLKDARFHQQGTGASLSTDLTSQ